jgi:hypothetical protein
MEHTVWTVIVNGKMFELVLKGTADETFDEAYHKFTSCLCNERELGTWDGSIHHSGQFWVPEDYPDEFVDTP